VTEFAKKLREGRGGCVWVGGGAGVGLFDIAEAAGWESLSRCDAPAN
jgi:hypothetical protein